MSDGIPLVIAEFTGEWERSLRRFTYYSHRPCEKAVGLGLAGGHDAGVGIGRHREPEDANGDNWPHDDPQWPTACKRCGYAFQDDDEWQRNDHRVYLRADGVEFVHGGLTGWGMPVGTMIRAPWNDAPPDAKPNAIFGPGEAWLIELPNGAGPWITNQRSSDGAYWAITGSPPKITVTPSIWDKGEPGWHGWIRDGFLVDA